MGIGPILALVVFSARSILAAAPESPRVEFVVERVTWGFRSASGPAWSPQGFLIFCDPPEEKLYRYAPGQKTQIYKEKTGRPTASGFDESGRLYVTETGLRRVSRQNAKGELEPLAGQWEGKPLNGPFDLAVRKDGHVFFTDPAFGAALDSKALPFYGVFRVTPKGEMHLISRSGQRPGGIALSPNGRTLYVAGADERVIRAWDLDRSGQASNERILISGVNGVPAGLRTDEKGNLWVACNKLVQYGPDGTMLRSIVIPEIPTGVALAAPDASVLYVTARGTVYRVRHDTGGPPAEGTQRP
jgi:gluconolactonase